MSKLLLNQINIEMAVTNIMVPMDFSAESKFAFDFAIDIAKKNNANVHVLHVAELHLEGLDSPLGEEIDTTKHLAQMVNHAQNQLDITTLTFL